MYKPRKIYKELLKHVTGTDLVTVITGMRRSGKTTLLKKILEDLPSKNCLYMDFQRLDNRDVFSLRNYEDIRNNFISAGLNPNEKMVIALDEIQLAPDAPSVIKYLYDHYRIKFVVTGSSSYYLKNLFSESLSGRKKIFELYPLSFSEFLDFKDIPHTPSNWRTTNISATDINRFGSLYEEYLRYGGFPEVVLTTSESEKTDLLKDIFSSYVNIDIKTLSDFSDERNLYALAKLLASRIGSKVDYSKLSRLTGLSRPTIVNYLDFFEKTYLISTIPVHTTNSDREIVKARKLYFCDTGIANILSEISSGSQFENTLYNQLKGIAEVSYYSLKNGQEIDFILDGKLAIEAKETPTVDDLLALEKISKKAKLKNYRLIGRRLSPKFDNYTWAGLIQ